MNALIPRSRLPRDSLLPIEGFILVALFIFIQILVASSILLPMKGIIGLDELIRSVCGSLLLDKPYGGASIYLRIASLLSSTLAYVLVLPAIFAYMQFRKISLCAYVGFSRERVGRMLLYLAAAIAVSGICLYAISVIQNLIYALSDAMTTVSSLLSLLGRRRSLDLVSRFLDIRPHLQSVVTMMQQEDSRALIIWMGVLAVLMAAVVEEVLFRGLFFKPLSEQIGLMPAALLSAFLFAGVHGNLHAFAHLFVFAIILAVLYERTRNILAPILLHLLHNGLSMALILLTAHAPQ